MDWSDRHHFLASLVVQMRSLLVDAARRRTSLKGGGGLIETIAREEALHLQSSSTDTLFIDDACTALLQKDRDAGTLAYLHYFGGFTWEDAGRLLGFTDRERRQLSKAADAFFVHVFRND